MARICLVTHVVAPWDGQGRVNYELARYLVRRDHAVTLVASEVSPKLLREPGIRWIRIPVPLWLPDLIAWGLFALFVWLRMAPSQMEDFDIVHLNGAIAPLPADVNTCHFVHSTWQRLQPRNMARSALVRAYQRLVSTICTRSEQLAYSTARSVVAVSDAVAAQLREDVAVAPTRIRTIYNGVDLVEFHPPRAGVSSRLREAWQVPPQAFVVLFVGDAKSPRKNLELALQAVAQNDPHFHLVVVGEARGGPYPALARKLGIEDRTHFIGPRRNVDECLRASDAVLCISHYEPASLVLLEGLATGLPVIATPGVGNAAFIVHGQNGLLLRSTTDVEGAAALLQQLGQDSALRRRIGEAARVTALELGWAQMGAQYEALYHELLQARRREAPASQSMLGAAMRSAEESA